MAVDRTLIRRSPGLVTYRGATLYPRGDINGRHEPEWDDVVSALHGKIDKTKKDLVIKNTFRLWGTYENLGVLFPAAVLTPYPGLSLCGDYPMVILGRNGDQITYPNTALTKLGDLYLGIDQDVWAADVEFTSIIQSGKAPEDSDAYYTVATGVAFADTGFAKTNFKRQRYSLALTGKTGFTSFEMQSGINIGWQLDVQQEYDANYGTVDLYVGEGGLRGICRGVPKQPTMANIETAGSAQSTLMGALLSAKAADLAITGSGVAITLKNTALEGHGFMWGIKPLRNGEIMLGTTTAFTTGTRQATATVA